MIHHAVDVLETGARVAIAFAIAFYISRPIAWAILPPRRED